MPFEPLFEEGAVLAPARATRVSDFYPTGWRKNLYRLAEDDAVGDNDFLYRSVQVALRLQREFATRGRRYEVVWVHISPAEANPAPRDPPAGAHFLGYDVAYLGGDFYSAVRNGLHVNPDEDLLARFWSLLNENGLFDSTQAAIDYLAAFRQSSTTESASQFYKYAVFLVADLGSSNN